MPAKKEAPAEEVVEYWPGLEEDKVKTLPLDKIDLSVNDFEFRLTTRFKDLVESIRENGQHFPIIVRVIPDTSPKKYEVVSGYRRVRALTELSIPEVKAIVRDLDDDTAYKISFMENEKRKNLTGVDKAHAIAKLRVLGKTTEEILDIYGIGQKQLERYEKVASFPRALKDAIADERIKTSHGLLLAQAREQHGEKVKLEEWIRRIEEDDLTVRKLQRALNKAFGKPKKKARYYERDTKTGGFRLYPMRFDPKTTDEATKAKLLSVLKEALGVLEGK
jgi:ParB/RepB/Spo0J family partition protein